MTKPSSNGFMPNYFERDITITFLDSETITGMYTHFYSEINVIVIAAEDDDYSILIPINAIKKIHPRR